MDLITIILVLLGILLIIKGGIQTFQRNAIVSALFLIFLAPVWIAWAIVEIFLPTPKNDTQKIED